jgi:hypothetical protein
MHIMCPLQIVALAHKQASHLIDEDIQGCGILKISEPRDGLNVLESRRVDSDRFSVDRMGRRFTTSELRAVLDIIKPENLPCKLKLKYQ